MLNINKFVFNPFFENTYLIWNTITYDALIIDPGCSNNEEENVLFDFIFSNKLNLKYLLNTHCHIDHILGVNSVLNKFNLKYFIPEKDLPLLQNSKEQAEMFGLLFREINTPIEFLSEELHFALGDEKLKCIFTPGHTPGEYCFYSETNKFCITGDVLFKQSIGRTDLWGGNYEKLIKSIKTKLLILPEDVIIYPGHGEKSTIGEEKKMNPFLIT